MLKVGLIGVGHLGKIHLKLLKEITSIEVVGFYDSRDDIDLQLAKNLILKPMII